ncbi:MAG: DUF1937 family protein [Candidatus Heimdallarchaeota archaeon]|nr:MAG: DUF1937 family protein [Candidatus Heimdallarchaeota archaeon]
MKNSFRNNLWYLAHPYTADSDEKIELNVKKANIIAAKLICAGLFVYSPISMTHWIHKEAVEMGLIDKSEWDLWMKFDYFFIENHCTGLIISPGWEDSQGCKEEYKRFQELKKPIYLLEEIYQELNIRE